MSLQFKRIHGETGDDVEQKVQEWLDEETVESIESVSADDSDDTITYSVFYRGPAAGAGSPESSHLGGEDETNNLLDRI